MRSSLWWLVPLNGFLLAPVLIHELPNAARGRGVETGFVFVVSVLWLLAAQLAWPRPRTVHALLFPFYLLTAVDLYLVAHYGTRLSSSTLIVLLENGENAWEYLALHAREILVILLPVLATYAWLLRRLGATRLHPPRALLPSVLGALAAVYGVASHRAGPLVSLATHDRSAPFGVIAQGYVAHEVFDEAVRQAAQARNFRFGARREQEASEPEAYVLVIGESMRPDHLALHGYRRNTTPRLGQLSGLIVFENVISQSALTKLSVPLLLTRGRIDEPRATLHERSVISAFAETGFRTHWLSTQQRDPFTGTINRYAGEAEMQRFFDGSQDDVLIEQASAIFRNLDAQKELVVLHLSGSHFSYPSRYPPSFDVFGQDRGTDRERLVNAYDNSIRFTDFVLAELIAALEQRPGIKALLYVADHGENLRDDERDLLGHMHSNEYDLPVPMLLWYSREFAERNPQQIAAATRNAKRPIGTRAVFHTLLDLASIQVNDPNTALLSVLSERHEISPRLVAMQDGAVDFDRWRTEQQIRASALSPRNPELPDEAL